MCLCVCIVKTLHVYVHYTRMYTLPMCVPHMHYILCEVKGFINIDTQIIITCILCMCICVCVYIRILQF